MVCTSLIYSRYFVTLTHKDAQTFVFNTKDSTRVLNKGLCICCVIFCISFPLVSLFSTEMEISSKWLNVYMFLTKCYHMTYRILFLVILELDSCSPHLLLLYGTSTVFFQNSPGETVTGVLLDPFYRSTGPSEILLCPSKIWFMCQWRLQYNNLRIIVFGNILAIMSCGFYQLLRNGQCQTQKWITLLIYGFTKICI